MKKQIQSYQGDEEGSVTIEAVIILPVIFVVFMSTFTYFDVFRAKSLALKANYAISDLLSRDDDNVTWGDLKGSYKLFRYLTRSSGDAWIRATVVKCKAKCAADELSDRRLRKMWSKAYPVGSVPRLTTTEIREKYNDLVPIMNGSEYLLIMETSSTYTTPFAGEWTGVFDRTFSDLVVTKPRGGPKLCFQDVDCNDP